jgi:hypothetical protein
MKQNLLKGHMNKGFFLSFFLSFQFCDIKSLETIPKKIAKLVELTLNKQNIMNYLSRMKQKNKKNKKKVVNDVIYKKKKRK